MGICARDPRHKAAYRAVLDYCSHGIQGIGPFEAEELVRLVEKAFADQPPGAVEALQQIYAYASGASGMTGDDAGHLTAVGMMAKEALALDRLGGQ